MASLRKKYRAETSDKDPPVTTAAAGAKLPEPAAEQAAPETNPADAAKESPIERAEQDAIRRRIREMENAENLQREVLTQQERFARERQQQAAQIPEHIRRWAEAHPQYLSDPIAASELQTAILKAQRDGKNWQDPDFIEVTERHLGLRQLPAEKQPITTRAYEASPRQAPPVRQYKGPPLSAPPTRENLSWSNGRPSGDTRLTAEEAQLARTLGLSPQQYQEEKAKMVRLKEAGVLRDGQ
jgi:hypothetical protein